MAAPRTLRLPLSASPWGGALLTAATNQGIEATRQTVLLRLAGGGTTQHPWLQNEIRPDLVFGERRTLAQQILARAREVFATLERQEVAKLLPETFVLEKDPRDGRWVASFSWMPLRIGGVNSGSPETLRYVVG